MGAILVYVTTSTWQEAETIGRAVVEEHLAACANIMDGMTSIYRWQGAIEQAQETVLLLKTVEDRLEPLTERIKSLHSYDLPCIAAIPITGGNADFLAWIANETV